MEIATAFIELAIACSQIFREAEVERAVRSTVWKSPPWRLCHEPCARQRVLGLQNAVEVVAKADELMRSLG